MHIQNSTKFEIRNFKYTLKFTLRSKFYQFSFHTYEACIHPRIERYSTHESWNFEELEELGKSRLLGPDRNRVLG